MTFSLPAQERRTTAEPLWYFCWAWALCLFLFPDSEDFSGAARGRSCPCAHCMPLFRLIIPPIPGSSSPLYSVPIGNGGDSTPPGSMSDGRRLSPPYTGKTCSHLDVPNFSPSSLSLESHLQVWISSWKQETYLNLGMWAGLLWNLRVRYFCWNTHGQESRNTPRSVPLASSCSSRTAESRH